ncbi:hypothetical protein GCM10007893_18230 [Paracoccus marinus]|nr:hypothetical protein GCM10007893_18230 [Paracoccus marinus]
MGPRGSMKNLKIVAPLLLVGGLAAEANGAVCDYRPSRLVGSAVTTTAGVAGAGLAATGSAANAVGVYTLVNATTGLTMVGGTWAGASAAGTAGIIAGTGGAIGTATAVVTAPVTIAVGAVAAVTVAAYEGACYFTDTRITDYKEVDAIVRNIALTSPPDLYSYNAGDKEQEGATITVRDPDSDEVRYDTYDVADLYVVNGVLKNRDWGSNTTIGIVGLIQGAN